MKVMDKDCSFEDRINKRCNVFELIIAIIWNFDGSGAESIGEGRVRIFAVVYNNLDLVRPYGYAENDKKSYH